MANELKIKVKTRSEVVETEPGKVAISVYATVGKHPEILAGTIIGSIALMSGPAFKAKWHQSPGS